ncbi:MAG: glycosyltransferase family 2 protein [Syntrophomonadaceae bacterium]|nr:glycosyltransferase family 2 protein [Syntrophomonadaceae bacterium]
MARVSLVIPAYNEEMRIVSTLQAVLALDAFEQILVVNDGSTDHTSYQAKQLGVEVLEVDKNRGKGGAMNYSLPYIKGDVVVFLDADLGDSAAEVQKVMAPVLAGHADLAIAAFPPAKKKGGFGLVKKTAARAIKKAGDMQVNAPLSGQRVMTRDVLEAVTPFNEAYGVELGMTIRALRQGFRVVEVPTNMTHNETGRDLSGFIHRGKQFVDVLKVVWLEKRRK